MKISKSTIIILVIVSLVVFSILIYLTAISIITAVQLLLTLVVILVLVGIPSGLYFFLKYVKKKQKLEGTARVLDASTAFDWAKEYMRKHYTTEIELRGDERILQVGTQPFRITLVHLNIFAFNRNNYYDLIISLNDPNGMHTILPGIHSREEILREAENLSSAPIYHPRRITRRILPEGVTAEVEEDISPPEVDEEVNEVEQKKQKDKK